METPLEARSHRQHEFNLNAFDFTLGWIAICLTIGGSVYFGNLTYSEYTKIQNLDAPLSSYASQPVLLYGGLTLVCFACTFFGYLLLRLVHHHRTHVRESVSIECLLIKLFEHYFGDLITMPGETMKLFDLIKECRKLGISFTEERLSEARDTVALVEMLRTQDIVQELRDLLGYVRTQTRYYESAKEELEEIHTALEEMIEVLKPKIFELGKARQAVGRTHEVVLHAVKTASES